MWPVLAGVDQPLKWLLPMVTLVIAAKAVGNLIAVVLVVDAASKMLSAICELESWMFPSAADDCMSIPTQSVCAGEVLSTVFPRKRKSPAPESVPWSTTRREGRGVRTAHVGLVPGQHAFPTSGPPWQIAGGPPEHAAPPLHSPVGDGTLQ